MRHPHLILSIGSHSQSDAWHAAKFILSVKERHCLTQPAIDTIMSSTTLLFEAVIDNALNEIQDSRENNQMVSTLLQTKVKSLFSQVATSYLQKKYFNEVFHKIVSSLF